MKLGTKSLIYGAHQFLLHPLLLAICWWKFYGFPWNYKLWFAFALHDIGYWGKSAMDDKDGKTHPELGAHIMGKLFGKNWETFTECHSRHYAKLRGYVPSRLCVADKYVICVQPSWLYLPMTVATGEINEYLDQAHNAFEFNNRREWLVGMRKHMNNWCSKNKDIALNEPSN